MKKKKSILYFIQLPPPIHGVSVINQQVFLSKRISKDFEKILLEIKFSDRIDQLRKISLKKILQFIRLCFSLTFILIVRKPDLVYFSLMPVGKGLYRDVFFVLIIKMFRRKILFHIHNRGIAKKSKKLLNRILYRWVFNKTDIIHLSEKLITEELLPLNLKDAKFHVVANGIKIAYEIPEKIYNKKEIRLLFLSNLFPEKGIFDLLHVFEKLCNEFQHIKLFIVGAPYGNMEHKIMDYLSQRSILKDKVMYFGPLYGEAKHKIFTESDIFVFPSYFQEECFPLVVLEAMSYGLPIVATRIGATDEIIKNNENGFIVEPKDISALQEKLQLLIIKEDLRIKMRHESNLLFNNYYTYLIFENCMCEIMCLLH